MRSEAEVREMLETAERQRAEVAHQICHANTAWCDLNAQVERLRWVLTGEEEGSSDVGLKTFEKDGKQVKAKQLDAPIEVGALIEGFRVQEDDDGIFIIVYTPDEGDTRCSINDWFGADEDGNPKVWKADEFDYTAVKAA